MYNRHSSVVVGSLLPTGIARSENERNGVGMLSFYFTTYMLALTKSSPSTTLKHRPTTLLKSHSTTLLKSHSAMLKLP